ncbi:MAG: hypothetical protein ACRC6B_13170 [Fusobacteriaceae bacterium]
MAYYFLTVIMLSYILDLKNKIAISIVSTFLILASLSRGSVGSLAIFYVLYFLNGIDLEKLNISKLIKVLIALVVLAFIFRNPIQNKIESISIRFTEKSENSSVIQRGWERIEKYPQYIIIGAGEGGVSSGKKFSLAHGATLETHSTWANFLLSYGILGTLLFVVFNLKYVNLKKYLPHYFTIAAHGMIQVDSRQTTFWLILIFMIYKSYLEKKKKSLDEED